MAVLVLVLPLLLASSALGRQFYFQNTLPFTIWVGSLGNPGNDPIDGGGWEMASGASQTQEVPDNWAGRFWARTGCNFDENGQGTCTTGDCGGNLKCNGAGGTPPVTLVEVTLQGAGGLDYYDVSLVDGFNVPASMTPTDQSGSGQSCTSANCNTDLNPGCPAELQVQGDSGIVACRSGCLTYNTDQYCCRGDYATPDACPANPYAQYFKQNCPASYSYAYDDGTSTFTCSGTNYQITFGTPA